MSSSTTTVSSSSSKYITKENYTQQMNTPRISDNDISKLSLYSNECLCDFPNQEFILCIANSIECIIDNTLKTRNSIFDNQAIPKISIRDYLVRIMKYCKINKSTIVMGLLYVDRLNSDFLISMYNIHKVILASILVASKINEDKIHTNFYFAKVGGINLYEMNLIEIDFLKLIDYNLLVDSAAFIKYINHIKTL